MKTVLRWFSRATEFVAAMMMAAMFATFIIQIFIRYSARLQWVPETFPFLDPSNFGWTLEFCLLMWVWIVFWGNSLNVRQHDHVIFDIIYGAVSPRVRKWFVVISAAAIIAGLLISIGPTWDRLAILRLKRTATLESLFGSGIRMRDIYIVYILFLVVVPLRYALRGYRAFRFGADDDLHHYDELAQKSEDSKGADGK